MTATAYHNCTERVKQYINALSTSTDPRTDLECIKEIRELLNAMEDHVLDFIEPKEPEDPCYE